MQNTQLSRLARAATSRAERAEREAKERQAGERRRDRPGGGATLPVVDRLERGGVARRLARGGPALFGNGVGLLPIRDLGRLVRRERRLDAPVRARGAAVGLRRGAPPSGHDGPKAKPPMGDRARRVSVAGPYAPSSSMRSVGWLRFHKIWNAFTERPRMFTPPAV